MAYNVLLAHFFPMLAHQALKAKSIINQSYQNWKDTREDLSNHVYNTTKIRRTNWTALSPAVKTQIPI